LLSYIESFGLVTEYPTALLTAAFPNAADWSKPVIAVEAWSRNCSKPHVPIGCQICLNHALRWRLVTLIFSEIEISPLSFLHSKIEKKVI
jgi:hypothetical protein